MQQSRTIPLVVLFGLFVSGCGGALKTTFSPPPVTPLPDYSKCISTDPIDPGNPNQPVIHLNGPNVVSLPLGSPYNDAGATAADPKDGDISGSIVVAGLSAIQSDQPGDYPIRYNVTDSAQLKAREAVRMVRVTDSGSFPVHTGRDIGTTSAHMGYYEHLPVQYSADPNQKFPLIVFIHGWGHARFLDETHEQVPLSSLRDDNFDGMFDGAYGSWDNSRPFIVLSPQKCVDALEYGVTAYRMKLFIDYAINTYNVDSTRIYVGGHSQGSGDSWDYVVNFPEQLAAIFPISGGYGTLSGCQLKDTPAWAFAGSLDTPVNTDQVSTVQSINHCQPPERAKVTIIPGADHNTVEGDVITLSGLGMGDPQYDIYNQSIYDWLLAHRRSH